MQEQYYYIPDNPLSQQARALINKYAILRAEAEDKRYTQERNEYYVCANCSRRGNKTKYHKMSMLEISRTTKRKGKIAVLTVHLCSECAKKYKPQSERVGCGTY